MRRFTELRDLEFQFIEQVLGKSEVLAANQDEKLTECVFNDPMAIFLLQGKVSCQSSLLNKQIITADSKEASNMLNNRLPRGGSIYAMSNDTVLLLVKKKDIGNARVERNNPLSHNHQSYAIADIDDDTNQDWMSKLLSSPLFQHLDPTKLHKLFVNLKETAYKSGDFIIREGEHDCYFYIIKSGQAEILRNKPGVNPIKICEGNFFGEGAIVGETIHSASIRMISDGAVCTIEAGQFNDLLKNIVLKIIDRNEISNLGTNLLTIDVRHPIEYRHELIPDSINLPINNLRDRLGELSISAAYLVNHGTDKRSQLAVLILKEHGFNAFLVN